MDYEIKRDENTITIKFNEPELIESFSDEKYSDLLMNIADEKKTLF
jgi:hypothetical protein